MVESLPQRAKPAGAGNGLRRPRGALAGSRVDGPEHPMSEADLPDLMSSERVSRYCCHRGLGGFLTHLVTEASTSPGERLETRPSGAPRTLQHRRLAESAASNQDISDRRVGAGR